MANEHKELVLQILEDPETVKLYQARLKAAHKQLAWSGLESYMHTLLVKPETLEVELRGPVTEYMDLNGVRVPKGMSVFPARNTWVYREDAGSAFGVKGLHTHQDVGTDEGAPRQEALCAFQAGALHYKPCDAEATFNARYRAPTGEPK